MSKFLYLSEDEKKLAEYIHDNNLELDSATLFLRKKNCDKIQSIRIIRCCFDLDLFTAEAKFQDFIQKDGEFRGHNTE